MRNLSSSVGSVVARRQFSASAAAAKLQKGVADELQFEKEQYEKPEIISKLPKEWKVIETPGNVNMKIEKELENNRICKIEWQLVAPFMDDEMEGMDGSQEGKEGEAQMPEMLDETDFTITIEKKDGEQGLTAFCNTQQGDGHRFVVGNVKVWSSKVERDDAAAYNGPDFEDLEDKVQEAMDEYLGEIGITDEIYDFIDASATDKETRDYMRWLENLNNFLKA
jgi:complement component 1 Q subcomponent-binding protein